MTEAQRARQEYEEVGLHIRDTTKEGEEQANLFSWAEMQSRKWPELKLMFHVPNGGKRSKSEAIRFRREGVKAGVPDIMLPAARGHWHGLFIEMKRKCKSRVSEEQKQWLRELGRQGYAVAVCYGWEEASECIVTYLKGEMKEEV